MKKKLISSLLAAALTLSLAACGSAPAASGSEAASEPAASSDAAASTESAAPTGDGFDASVDYAALAGTTITVAASPVPHAEILAVAADILAQADITLDVMEFTDYIQPNQATENGEVDANYFQHGPYLENFNAENGTHLVSVGAIHYEPLGLYPGKAASLDALADGAQIGVPNDPTNEARALQLLAAQGLITLREGAGLEATKNDIEETPRTWRSSRWKPPSCRASSPPSIWRSSTATMPARPASPPLRTHWPLRTPPAMAAQTYANVLVVKEGSEDTPPPPKPCCRAQEPGRQGFYHRDL